MACYLDTKVKTTCFGCESCVNACKFSAISMKEDDEAFTYPVIDYKLCTNCGACRKACPYVNMPETNGYPKLVFGGSNIEKKILEQSTSGGAFSAIVQAWFESGENRLVCGAVAHGLEVRHEFACNFEEASKFRKSKYVQSRLDNVYLRIKEELKQGVDILFSGTPCQIAGLKAFLGGREFVGDLVTVEVICEGVPSPLYIRRFASTLELRYGAAISELDYRYKDGNKWDFEVMAASLENGHHFKIDRWFNPFWSVWLQHLMSRPSCYECPFAKQERMSDLTLGDLWGVHLYCPDLYNKNAGASLIVCNSCQGADLFKSAQKYMKGHELKFEDALRYQSPMRNHISPNHKRSEFIRDLKAYNFGDLNNKWSKKPTLRLLFQKYIWGNRQKVALWNITHPFDYQDKEQLDA